MDILPDNIQYTTNKKQLWLKKETAYCNNCGKYGHSYKRCFEPILSYGIICIDTNDINIDNFCLAKYKFPDNIQSLKNICILKYIQKNISCNNKKDLDIYEEKILQNIKTVMVRRKFTYNYIYIIRGLYDMDLENIIKSINLLTIHEYNNILIKEFDELWNELWENNYNSEYYRAKESFQFLKTYILPQIKHKLNITYEEPEWGFPKGKRNDVETNIDCAIREFEEETGLENTQYTLLDRLFPLIEIIKGSDGLDYKHIYYIAILNKNVSIVKKDNYEIGDVNIFTIDKSINILRDYNTERKELINNLKLFLIYNIRYLEKFYHEKN
jgi:ADP-ribose pyrophosphatase YjhB (NUDIX family)